MQNIKLYDLLWEAEEKDKPKEEVVGPKNKNIVLVNDGSFNPVHRGHINVSHAAKKAATELGYNVVAVYMTPKHSSWLEKKFQGRNEKIIPAKERLELLKGAVKSDPEITVDDWEINQGSWKDSKALRDHYESVHPNTTFVMIVGEDYGECAPIPCFEIENGTWQLRLPRTEDLSSTLIRKLASTGKQSDVDTNVTTPDVWKLMQDLYADPAQPPTANESYIDLKRWNKIAKIKR